MHLYSELELDNDIKYLKTLYFNYSAKYKIFTHNISCINKKISSRIYFITYLFNNIFNKKMNF